MKNQPKKVDMPLILKKETVWIDCDDTLILHDLPLDYDGEMVHIPTPGSNFTCNVAVNTEIVNQLKKHHKMGKSIIVWSYGGVNWAESVVKALQLEPWVDVISGKPDILYDDTSPSMWLPDWVMHPLPNGWECKLSGIRYMGKETETREDENKRKARRYQWKDTY